MIDFERFFMLFAQANDNLFSISREARPPVELALSDRQLTLCAALCLCGLEGAGECASGAMTASGTGCSEEGAGQLGQAIARRLKDRLWHCLNNSLGAFSSERLVFAAGACAGAVPLRTGLLVHNNLVAHIGRLIQVRNLHRQFLMGSNCWNVPLELFAVHQEREMLPMREGEGNMRKRKAEEDQLMERREREGHHPSSQSGKSSNGSTSSNTSSSHSSPTIQGFKFEINNQII